MINIVTTPQILTDDIFTDFGGQTGTSTAAQRQAAYAIAEGQAASEIGTFVQPTIVTGTHSWPLTDTRLQLRYDRVISVPSLVAIHDAGCDCAENAIEISGCAWIKSAGHGIIDIQECGNTVKAQCSGCCCGRFGNAPFQARIVYEAGLPTTAVDDPRLLMALTTVADLALEQIIDPSGAEGGPGDMGVQQFNSLNYSETRFPLVSTAFGSSARANYAATMISVFKNKTILGL